MMKAHRPALLTPLALLATWFGSGRLPKMPGTWGSLAALPFAVILNELGGISLLVLASIAVGLAGISIAARYAALLGQSDPGEVVIDEVAGQWLAVLPAFISPLAYPIGFAIFRIFDTLKPWPIKQAERLPGGYGIMADDIVAGGLAAGINTVIIFALNGMHHVA